MSVQMDSFNKSVLTTRRYSEKEISQVVKDMKKKPKFIKIRKCLLVVLSLSLIALIWSFFIGINAYLTLSRYKYERDQGEQKIINYTNTSLKYYFETIDAFEKIFNDSNLEVKCPPGFSFRGSLCSWNCGEWHPIGLNGIEITRAILSFLAISGIIMCIITLITFIMRPIFAKNEPKLRNLSKIAKLFNSLSSLSTFFVILFSTLIMLSYATIDLPHPADVFCREEAENNVVYKLLYVFEPKEFLIPYGIVYHFSIISFFLWIIITLVNILLLLLFPVKLGYNLHAKIIIFSIESALSIIIPLSLVIIAIFFGRYSFVYPLQLFDVRPALLSVTTYVLPNFIGTMIIIALIILIVCRLRWMFLSQRQLSCSKVNLNMTSLEYKMIAYSTVAVFLLTLTSVIFIGYYNIAKRYYEVFYDELVCITLSSPVIINGTQLYTTSKEYISSQAGSEYYYSTLVDSCKNSGVYNKLYPAFVIAIAQISVRCTFVSAFLFILPSQNNYLCWKNIANAIGKTLKIGEMFSLIISRSSST